MDSLQLSHHRGQCRGQNNFRRKTADRKKPQLRQQNRCPKPNFTNNPTCRLINPSKSEIGIVSKKILQRVNAKIVSTTDLNQWKNADSVLAWFNKIPNKPSYSFITDIIDFYPSISEDLLIEALTFAAQLDEITDKEKATIIQAKNSLLFDENVVWCKKESNSLFDVTMGSFDSAETCELVGSYLLSKLSPLLGNAVGLAALNKNAKRNRKHQEADLHHL